VAESAGSKRYNKQTVYKLVKQYKPTNMVLWETIAVQYRVACGELEARFATVIKKFFVTKMCNSMRKPTDSSGIDDMTAKSQSLQRSLHQIEEGDTFGDEMDQEKVSKDGSESSASDSEDSSLRRRVLATEDNVDFFAAFNAVDLIDLFRSMCSAFSNLSFSWSLTF